MNYIEDLESIKNSIEIIKSLMISLDNRLHTIERHLDKTVIKSPQKQIELENLLPLPKWDKPPEPGSLDHKVMLQEIAKVNKQQKIKTILEKVEKLKQISKEETEDKENTE